MYDYFCIFLYTTGGLKKKIDQLATISSSIKLFILVLIILDLISFYHFSSDLLKVLSFILIVFMQIPIVMIVVINSYTEYEENISDKIRRLINFFFNDPLCAIIFILLFSIVSLIIRIPILQFLQVNTLNLVLIIPIFIGTLLPFLILIHLFAIYMTFQEFNYDNLLNFLIKTINMKNIKYLIIVITFFCLCKIFIFIYFFDLTLDFSAITEPASTKLFMNINKLLNSNPNIGNNNTPQVPVPDPVPNPAPDPGPPADAPPVNVPVGQNEVTHVSTRHLAETLTVQRQINLDDQKVGPFRVPVDPELKELGYDFRLSKQSPIYNKALISVRRDYPGLFNNTPGLTKLSSDFIADIRNLHYNIPI